MRRRTHVVDSTPKRDNQKSHPSQAQKSEASYSDTPDSGRPVTDSASLSADSVLALQRTIGNRAVRRLIQAKLLVGASDDSFEREADLMADGLGGQEPGVAAPEGGRTDARGMIRREDEPHKPLEVAPASPVGGEATEEDEGTVQRKANGQGGQAFEAPQVFEKKLGQTLRHGNPMPGNVQASMESYFGSDFSDVRIHTDADSAQLNRSVGAAAFTHNQDIYMGEGRYSPESFEGRKLIAHELTHVVQQSGVQRRSSIVTRQMIQRFTDDDVKKRAQEIWQKKGSPPNQSKEDQDKDYFDARHQLETEERAHGLWQEKGSPKDQSEADQKKDFSDAEFQLATVKEVNAIGDLAKLKTKLFGVKDRGWRILRYIFQNMTDAIRDLIRPDKPTLDMVFAMCSSADEKAELLYYLKGDAAWKETAMTDYGINQNAFREALVRLGVFEAGTAGHKRGPEVDKLIATHLSAQVQKNFEARGRITGRVAVLGAAEWEIIGKADYGVQWATKKNTLNAFVDRSSDPPRVFVNKDRGNAGTAIHEAVHMWGSSARPINAESHELNEGVTEYFARKVCSALTPAIPRTVYGKQFAIASRMVATVGEDVVARAFFDGDLAGLKAAFHSNQRWSNFTQFIEASSWAQAESVLEAVSRKNAVPEGDFEISDIFSNMA